MNFTKDQTWLNAFQMAFNLPMKFYVIQKKPKNSGKAVQFRTDFTYDDSVSKSDAPKCLKCGRFIGMLEALPPYRIHLETWGEGYGDLAFWMTNFLVSEAFRDSFFESGLKWLSKFTQVSVISHTQHGSPLGDPPSYFHTIPVIGGARVDLVASGVEWERNEHPSCDHCLQGGGTIERWQRVIIDEQSWTGDDVSTDPERTIRANHSQGRANHAGLFPNLRNEQLLGYQLSN